MNTAGPQRGRSPGDQRGLCGLRMQQAAPPADKKGRLSTAVPTQAGGYAGSSTGFAGSPPFFSQRSFLAMASEKEWATVA
ncbi:hypothetical protein GCM10010236_78440 [Streptomyces eurythermus]|nr:hypothetical protein GCM10010236_78440 [Streptomyces eurythermus]